MHANDKLRLLSGGLSCCPVFLLVCCVHMCVWGMMLSIGWVVCQHLVHTCDCLLAVLPVA